MANRVVEPSGRQPARYQIQIEGKIREDWSDWFSGMDISTMQDSDGCQFTTLMGMVPDQAALRGILCHIWDLNLTLLSVTRIEWQTRGKNE